jgi:hypothetical protein
LNADQEQRERIQEFRAIEFHLKDVLGVTTTESQNILGLDIVLNF